MDWNRLTHLNRAANINWDRTVLESTANGQRRECSGRIGRASYKGWSLDLGEREQAKKRKVRSVEAGNFQQNGLDQIWKSTRLRRVVLKYVNFFWGLVKSVFKYQFSLTNATFTALTFLSMIYCIWHWTTEWTAHDAASKRGTRLRIMKKDSSTIQAPSKAMFPEIDYNTPRPWNCKQERQRSWVWNLVLILTASC